MNIVIVPSFNPSVYVGIRNYNILTLDNLLFKGYNITKIDGSFNEELKKLSIDNDIVYIIGDTLISYVVNNKLCNKMVSVIGDTLPYGWYFDKVMSIGNFIIHYVDYAYDSESDFQSLINRILKKPLVDNRTIYKTMSEFNVQLNYDLNNNVLPVSTLRKQAIKSIFYELMWFINGRTDLQYLHDKNIHIWDANVAAMETINVAAMETINVAAMETINVAANVGETYGHQWRNFANTGFDQISYIDNLLANDKYSRRIVLSAWAPPNIFTKACLPPCHILYQFNVEYPNILHCNVYQRSSDVVLALNWNVVSAAFLTHMFAKNHDLKPGKLTFNIGNAHIYENQVEAAKEILSRKAKRYPVLNIKQKKSICEYTYEDMEILNYFPLPVIAIGAMAV
jgi:thymidylate synthase